MIVAFLAWSLAACAEAMPAPGDPGSVSEAFASAYNATDAVAIASLYAEDAALMPPDAHPVKGRAAIEALFREKFEQDCSMEVHSLASEVAGARGFDTGEIAITMSGEGGMQRVTGKYLAVLTRVGGEWKFAYHMQTVEPR